MAAKVFTEEQRKILSKNPNVESVEKTRIIYTEAFKSYYVKNYLAGKKPTEIFIEAGFDPSILGNKRIERASARWRKLYADGQLIIDTKENISVETKEEKIMNSELTKKRRGRPRKNPVVETVAETKKEEYTVDMPKKKRGRPRKNPEVVSQVEATENKAKTVKKRVNKIAAMAQNIKLAEPVVKKEVKEEAGLNVKAIRIIAIQDRNLHNIPPYVYNVCKVFVLCEIESGYFRPNIETDESAYFGLEELPILAKEKNNEEQIKMCFSAYYDRNWQVLFD